MEVFVIGGGAAGMMSACAVKGKATVLERNGKLGMKLYITGKGRCNLSNDLIDNFPENIISNPRFAASALNFFPPSELKEFFASNGLTVKTERGGRIFPASDKSSDVIKAFQRTFEKKGVTALFNTNVTDFIIENKHITKIVTDRGEYSPDSVILACGGRSYPSTGSDGSGYRLAERCGHTIVPPAPALVPIILDGVFAASGERRTFDCSALAGLSLRNVEAAIRDSSGKVLFKHFGEMLFTHTGVSGPIILSLSSRINRLSASELTLCIDLKPALEPETLDRRLLRDFGSNINKQFKNSLDALLPTKLIPLIIGLSGIDAAAAVNGITRFDRLSLVKLLKNLRFRIRGLGGIDEGIITAGGVNVNEIDPKTMRSKLIDNLYFAGEIIDIDALTGGYNLQLAFSTGRAAGHYSSINEKGE